MKRIALYGGSFDPPHMGHVMVVEAMQRAGLVDEIWLVPTGKHKCKDQLTDSFHRKAMIEAMLRSVADHHIPTQIKTWQMDRCDKISTTIDLLEEVEQRYPAYQFYVVIGSDLLRDLPQWHRSEELMQKARFLMVPRLGEPEHVLPPCVTAVVVNPQLLTDVSSSMVRTMLATNAYKEGVIPPAVRDYIVSHRLYQKKTEML